MALLGPLLGLSETPGCQRCPAGARDLHSLRLLVLPMAGPCSHLEAQQGKGPFASSFQTSFLRGHETESDGFELALVGTVLTPRGCLQCPGLWASQRLSHHVAAALPRPACESPASVC